MGGATVVSIRLGYGGFLDILILVGFWCAVEILHLDPLQISQIFCDYYF